MGSNIREEHTTSIYRVEPCCYHDAWYLYSSAVARKYVRCHRILSQIYYCLPTSWWFLAVSRYDISLKLLQEMFIWDTCEKCHTWNKFKIVRTKEYKLLTLHYTQTTAIAINNQVFTAICTPGYTVAQLVEASRYKPEVRGFDSRWCHWHNPSGRTVALGLAQPLTEMSTRNISWGVKAASAQGWQPYHLRVQIVLKSGSLNILEPSGPVQTCNWIGFTICTPS